MSTDRNGGPAFVSTFPGRRSGSSLPERPTGVARGAGAWRASLLSGAAALSLVSCSGGASGGSSTRGATTAAIGSGGGSLGSTTSTTPASSAGSVGTSAGSGGSTQGSSSSAGGTSATGSSGTSSGGSCGIGAPGGLQTGSVCFFPFDCDCGLACAPDISGGTGNLVCQVRCRADGDCPLPAETCETDAGLCLGGLFGSCSKPSGVDLEFYACVTNVDCPCPLECYSDPVLGPACETPCDSKGGCHVFDYCNSQMGSCQQSCSTAATVTEFQGCGKPTDCLCPLSCFGDARRGGQVCELPCQKDSDCTDAGAGEFCEGDAGSCELIASCHGLDAGLPAYALCVNAADCACPLSCVADPLLAPAGAVTPPRFCELCDGDSCQSVTGACQTPALAGSFQSSDAFPCTSNDSCGCPNRCVSSVQIGALMCEQECQSDADCSDPAELCQGGQCTENICYVPLACDLANGRDFPPDAGDGTCFPSPPLGEMVCHQGGTATDACNPLANRSETSQICGKGLACTAETDGGGFHCLAACGADSDCGGGAVCIPSLATCLPLDDAGTCFLGGTPVEFTGCGFGTYCGCAYDCVNGVCEQPCQRDSDCLDHSQICVGTVEQSYCLPGGG